jgi:hypothetical protein
VTDSPRLEKILSDDLKSGLKITLIDEAGELYARVSWIHWDSGFRDRGLEVEDRIIALNGTPLTLPEDPKARRIARDRMIGGLNESKFGSSLESEWVSACPTYGQQDDARDFYKAAFERVERHLKAVESVAREFEDRWNGVFQGALAPKTVDELLDTAARRMNAETLVNIRTPSVIEGLLDKMDGYYEESFEEPLEKLKDKAADLSGEQKEEALRAVDLVRKRVEESVRARIKTFQSEVAASLKWFEADEIKKTLDRSELEDGLE